MPTLSVIVPNYNHASFLRQRLDSVFGQEFEDYEVILLDDCSTDGSRELLRQYHGHKKVAHVVLNDKNSGSTFLQWRKGIELASGKYIWIAESDDVADSKLSGALVKCLEDDERVGLSFCQSLIINDRGEVLRDNIEHTAGFRTVDWEREFKMAGRRALIDFFQTKNIVPNASAAVFRKDLVRCLDEIVKFRFAGDWLLWVEILKQSNLCYIPDRLNCFRYHEQVSRNMNSIEKVSCYLQERYGILSAIERAGGAAKEDLTSGYQKVFNEWKKRIGLRSIFSSRGLAVVLKLSRVNLGFLRLLVRTLTRRVSSLI